MLVAKRINHWVEFNGTILNSVDKNGTKYAQSMTESKTRKLKLKN